MFQSITYLYLFNPRTAHREWEAYRPVMGQQWPVGRGRTRFDALTDLLIKEGEENAQFYREAA